MHTLQKGTGDTPETPVKIAWSRSEKTLLAGAVVSGLGLGGLGLWSSFHAMYDKARKTAAHGGWEWGQQAWMLPVGVDLAILVFSIVNLLLVKMERPLAWVKWIPRGCTVLTIALNWSAGATLEAQLGHAGIAGLWVVLSEIAAHLYRGHIGRLRGAREMEGIRLGRWIAHPIGSTRIRMLMISNEITSYAEALERDKALMVYRSDLRRAKGRFWRFKADEADLQVLRLVKYGMTVEEALQEPFRREIEESKRELQRDLQKEQLDLQKTEAEHEKQLRAITWDAERQRAEGERDAAREQAAAETSATLQEQQLGLQLRQEELQKRREVLQAESQAKIARLQAEAKKSTNEVELETLDEEIQRRRTEFEEELRRRSEQIQAEARREADAKIADAMKEAQSLVEGAQGEAEGQLAQARVQLDELLAEQRRVGEELKGQRAALAGDLKQVERQRDAAESALKEAEGRLKALEAESDKRAYRVEDLNHALAVAEARLKAVEDQTEAAREEAEALLKPADGEVLAVALWIKERQDLGGPEPTIEELKQRYGFSQGTASARRRLARTLVENTLVKQ